MKLTSMKIRLVVIAALLLAAQAVSALTITGAFSGSWYDPSENGHGFNIEVISGPDGNIVLAYWYTFDEDGNQVWGFGTGMVDRDTVFIAMESAAGAVFPGFDNSGLEFAQFADITMHFTSCDVGDAEWVLFSDEARKEQVGTGIIALERITGIVARPCSGGISDDISPESPPSGFSLFLEANAVAVGATAKIDLELEPGQAQFNVELKDAPAGSYDLVVDGVIVGTMDLTQKEQVGTGFQFRSPAETGKQLLDFDPRGSTVEILFNGDAAMSDSLPTDVPPVDTSPVPFGNAEYEVELVSTGLDPDAEGEAQLEQRPDRVEFEVEVEDLTVGTYDLIVSGIFRGSIEVMTVPGGTNGEIDFRIPSGSGKPLLDFDPRGKSIEVEQDGLVYLEAQFPTVPTETFDDDDDDCDKDGDDDCEGGDDDCDKDVDDDCEGDDD